jgi:HK97 gp10 family phage protein
MIDQAQLKKEIANAVEKFKEFSVKAESAVDKAILKGALVVEATAKELVSDSWRTRESEKGAPPRLVTGRLRSSITHRLEADLMGVSALVGTNVDYARGLEFGTSKTFKHPFMYPALKVNREAIIDAIRKAVKNA